MGNHGFVYKSSTNLSAAHTASAQERKTTVFPPTSGLRIMGGWRLPPAGSITWQGTRSNFLSNDPADRLINFFWRAPAQTVAERCRRRVTLRLVPYLFFLYILAYLDRVNVSVAALGMAKPPEEGGLGFSREVIGKGFGMFFWGYWALEIPSTLI